MKTARSICEKPEPCPCGGETKRYQGLLGYEAQVCQKCGEHWADHSEAAHREHLIRYENGERNK